MPEAISKRLLKQPCLTGKPHQGSTSVNFITFSCKHLQTFIFLFFHCAPTSKLNICSHLLSLFVFVSCVCVVQHMVQNQMTPSYPAFSQTAGIEEFQQQTGAIPTQAPTPAAAAVAADPQAQFKTATDQAQSAAVTTVTNGVEQQTVSVLGSVILMS